MSILNNSLLLGADAAAGGYQISRSVRFNSSDSAYLSRTPGTAGNRKTWTWAGWVKRSADTTQASSSDRAKIYVNGAQVTAFSTAAYPSQNTDLLANQAIAHFIGKNAWGVSGFNGYLADIHFIDGQALDPSSFGEFDTNGVWQPIAYAGSYGTNGFHLPFSDNSTAAALGTDTSSQREHLDR
jgi:hypothetical protein